MTNIQKVVRMLQGRGVIGIRNHKDFEMLKFIIDLLSEDYMRADMTYEKFRDCFYQGKRLTETREIFVGCHEYCMSVYPWFYGVERKEISNQIEYDFGDEPVMYFTLNEGGYK